MKLGALALSVAVLVTLLPLPGQADGEVGFIEKFALAPDREAVLTELIPGSDEYYFFHALHYQNTRQTQKLADILEQWKKRQPNSPQRVTIENREALLSYGATPQATLDFLRKRLNLQFTHEQEVRGQKPNLPSALDQARISRDVFQAEALTNDNEFHQVSVSELERLVRDKVALKPSQVRSLLSRLERPDVPNLVDVIEADLKTKESRGFGEFGIHRALLPDQLDELAKRIPALAENQAYIFTRIHKLEPGADSDIEYDAAEREAWLDRVWAYVSQLTPANNSLKANVLYQRLKHDRARGIYDEARFFAYVQLPRRTGYVNPKYSDAPERIRFAVNLGENFSGAMSGAAPIGNDEELVRDYFLHLLPKLAAAQAGDLDPAALLKKWTPFIRESWLKPVLAEAMITNGIGQPERWASLISPAAFQALKDRVDIEFSPANREFNAPADDVSLDLYLKNSPKLIVKIYEINALSYFLANQRQLNTDLPLDGLVANREVTHDFTADKDAANPIRRTLHTFKFPELKGRHGAWIIEFIGGGKSSRALVRKGQWSILQHLGPAGEMLTVFDEAHQPVKDAAVWVDGRKFTTDEKSGEIIVPFAKQASENAVISDASGEFATLVHLERHPETYTFTAGLHIANEQLLTGQQATLAMHPQLLIGDTQMPLSLLENVKLTITCRMPDGVSTTSEVAVPTLDPEKDFTHSFMVPGRLFHINVSVSAQVAVISQGNQKQDLATGGNWDLNRIDYTAATNRGSLSSFSGNHFFELLGKNGEPVANQPIDFVIKHKEFTGPIHLSLQTDDKGRVNLGPLRGIEKVEVGDQHWALSGSERTRTSTIHANFGDEIVVPWTSDSAPEHASLLEVRDGTFVANVRSAVAGFPKGAWDPSAQNVADFATSKPELSAFVLKGLPPGDYSLSFSDGQPPITIRVTNGKPVEDWLISPSRELEIRDYAPLNILSVKRAGDGFAIQLANADKFTRVHVAATRFLPETNLFQALGRFPRFNPASNLPARQPNLFAAGREIGDEYRYILERRYSKTFPGNMLTRPGLILNPFEVRSTDHVGQQMAAMQAPGSTTGGRAAVTQPAVPAPAIALHSEAFPTGGPDLNFLANPAPVLYNLAPDEHGVVRITAKDIGDRQYVQIYAEDLNNAVFRTLSLPEAPTAFKDLRLAHSLDPKKIFAEKNEQSVLAKGDTITLADVLTSELETYDSLAAVHSLFTTLSGSRSFAKFAWILDWPNLKPEEKSARYSEFACHELNLFLSRKDPDFFAKVILPYLRNKKDRTFMDDYLLGNDLHGYLEPWSYERLNVAERCLLSQRIPGERAATARHLRELWELLPPNPDHQVYLFETALHGRTLNEAQREWAKQAGMIEAKGRDAGESRNAAGNIVHTKTKTSSLARDENPAGEPIRPQDEKEEVVNTPAPPVQPGSSPPVLVPSAASEEEAEQQIRSLYNSGKIMNYRIYGRPLSSAAEAARQRAEGRQFFRALGPTKEWAENNYYQLPIAVQNADLVSIDAFWRDYAAWDGKSPFLSANLAEAGGSFSEMMLALAVLDLPFSSPKHASKSEGAQFTLTAAGPLIAFRKELMPAGAPEENAGLLISENFYREGDRYRMEGNEKFDKFVTGEFLSGVVYGGNVVVTNPSSTPQKLELLLQIPQGAMPVKGSNATDSKRIRLEPYTTQTFDYFFYFPEPAAAPYAHYPVSATRDEQGLGAAKASTFKVVKQLSEVDTKSWDYVSQFASDDEVFAFLERENIERLDLDRVAWRARKSAEFFHRMIATLEKRHTYDDVLYSYAVVYNDAPTLGEWLKHQTAFVSQLGPWLSAKLLTVDPIERRAYQHLDYSPLVNQRAHRVGAEQRIPNPVLRTQYLRLLDILAFKPSLDAMDQMSLTYYQFLQNRTEEALARFHAIPAAALPTKIQYDYFRCYADFYEERLADARGIANQYADYPVDRWRKLFAEVTSQLDEIEGKAPAAKAAAGAGQNDANAERAQQREAQQSGLAATEPSFDFKVENRQITLNYKNLREVSVRYYLMDPEFLFSASPFVAEDVNRASIVKPTKAAVEKLHEGADHLQIPLPAEFEKANVLVEILGAGLRKSQAYHANTLKLNLVENYGRLEVRDEAASKPVSKAYVKVYARLRGGTIRFFKDGYTDLRGKFDYASLNSSENPQPEAIPDGSGSGAGNFQMLQPQELNSVEKLSILILSGAHGAAVREVNPPTQATQADSTSSY